MDSSTLEAQMTSTKRRAARLVGGDLLPCPQEGSIMAKASSRSSGKPSKASLSKAGRTLASNSSSKPAKSKAGSTLGKG